MKVVIVLACLIAVAVAESCNGVDTTQCANEVCSGGFVPTCVTGVCTCNPAPKPSGCVTLADCNTYWRTHHCSLNHRMCADGNCKCAHGSPGK